MVSKYTAQNIIFFRTLHLEVDGSNPSLGAFYLLMPAIDASKCPDDPFLQTAILTTRALNTTLFLQMT